MCAIQNEFRYVIKIIGDKESRGPHVHVVLICIGNSLFLLSIGTKVSGLQVVWGALVTDRVTRKQIRKGGAAVMDGEGSWSMGMGAAGSMAGTVAVPPAGATAVSGAEASLSKMSSANSNTVVGLGHASSLKMGALVMETL